MKYLFEVNDQQEDIINLYAIEGNTQEEAERIFAKRFIPYIIGADFKFVGDCLASMDIIISSLGPMNQIKEL